MPRSQFMSSKRPKWQGCVVNGVSPRPGEDFHHIENHSLPSQHRGAGGKRPRGPGGPGGKPKANPKESKTEKAAQGETDNTQEEDTGQGVTLCGCKVTCVRHRNNIQRSRCRRVQLCRTHGSTKQSFTYKGEDTKLTHKVRVVSPSDV